jgi:hypothetical protein
MKDEKKEYGYIQFPLCLLQRTFEDPEQGLNLILRFGIVNYAKKFEYSITEVARQLMYCYYRNNEMIQSDLYTMIQKYIDNEKLFIDEDYYGFSSDQFTPLEFSDVLSLFEADNKFQEAAILRYQIGQAVKSLNIKPSHIDNIISGYKEGLRFKSTFELKYGSDSWPNVKTSQVFEFRDSGKDLDLFRAYIAIKSLIGLNNYTSTHKTVILSRMLGCKSNDSLHGFLENNDEVKEIYKKYSGRKRMDNLLFKLMERKFILMLSKKHESRIYVSVKIKNPKEFAELILENRKQSRLKKELSEANQML